VSYEADWALQATITRLTMLVVFEKHPLGTKAKLITKK